LLPNIKLPNVWFPEFVVDVVNSFVIPNTEISEHKFQHDETDAHNLYNLPQKTVIPMYYDHPDQWLTMIRSCIRDILSCFHSKRMADEYYKQLHTITRPQS
jgi:starch phosphorylase